MKSKSFACPLCGNKTFLRELELVMNFDYQEISELKKNYICSVCKTSVSLEQIHRKIKENR